MQGEREQTIDTYKCTSSKYVSVLQETQTYFSHLKHRGKKGLQNENCYQDRSVFRLIIGKSVWIIIYETNHSKPSITNIKSEIYGLHPP